MKDIKLLLFKEVSAADARKFAADAADADTGRGARDLRFPHEAFDPVFARLLPKTEEKAAGRKKTDVVPVRCGTIRWHTGDVEHSAEIEYWPPNTARPREGRWAKVNTISKLAGGLPENEGRTFVVLTLDEEDVVWLHIVTETNLKDPEWNQQVASRILSCAEENGRAQGYIDFEKGGDYCHGE